MDKTTINNSDLSVSPINFGGNVFGFTLDEAKSFEILDAFTAAGGNFIDTADIYAAWVNGVGGQSETILGKWMKERGNRNDVVIATKVGGENSEHPVDTSRAHILKSVDESLSRLQTDYIDLYYTHFDDGKTPVEETMTAYDELIKSGKVRYIAASNINPERLTESMEFAAANGTAPYIALQPHYNLVEREGYESQYLSLVEKYNFSVFPYWSLASGFLSGKYRSEADLGKSVRGDGAKKYLNDKGLGVLKALDAVSEKHGAKVAATAIAWLMAQKTITAPIVSATSQSQLDTLVSAASMKLDEEDLSLLDSASK